MTTKVNTALGWGGRRAKATLRAADGTVWPVLSPAEAPGFAADFGKLAELAASPEASEAAEVADKWLAAFRERRAGTVETASQAARLLRTLRRGAELAQLQASYPGQAGTPLLPVTAAGMAGVAWEVAAEPGMPPSALDRAAANLRWILDTYEFRDAAQPLRKESVRYTLAAVRLRQHKPHEVPSLCVRALAVRDLPATERASVLAAMAMARRQLGQPHQELLRQAQALDPQADLVAEAVAKPAAATPASASWPPKS